MNLFEEISKLLNTKTCFIDDRHLIFNSGKYAGMRIADVPKDYLDWVIRNMRGTISSNREEIIDAIIRIRNRRSVTELIKHCKIIPLYVPTLSKTSINFPPIERPTNINYSLYGSFVEYLVKESFGLSITDESQKIVDKYPVGNMSNTLKEIYNSHVKIKKSVQDICILSFSHSYNMDHFNKYEACILLDHVRKNEEYYQNYAKSLCIPISPETDQNTCDKISVGCVTGVIDLISDDSIIDIKCCANDDLNYYRMQLFAYACLHYLRYGDLISRCEIYNFLNGRHYIMPLGDSCKKYAKDFICMLGDCPHHQKLFVN